MVSTALQQVLDRLGSLRDAQKGLPISSHRPGVGRLVVSVKRLMRFVLQPLINEILLKQSRFNEETLVVLRSLVLDLKSLQDGTIAANADVEERLRRMEKNIERLAQASRSESGQLTSPVFRG
jgi:hypothetical protein